MQPLKLLGLFYRNPPASQRSTSKIIKFKSVLDNMTDQRETAKIDSKGLETETVGLRT